MNKNITVSKLNFLPLFPRNFLAVLTDFLSYSLHAIYFLSLSDFLSNCNQWSLTIFNVVSQLPLDFFPKEATVCSIGFLFLVQNGFFFLNSILFVKLQPKKILSLFLFLPSPSPSFFLSPPTSFWWVLHLWPTCRHRTSSNLILLSIGWQQWIFWEQS